jgi:hypothetical protein
MATKSRTHEKDNGWSSSCVRVFVACLLLNAAHVVAQTSDTPPDSMSLERVRAALTAPPPALIIPPDTPAVHLGPLTLVQPEMAGEAVRVKVPVGAMVMDAVHGVAAAKHRRDERKAREDVQRELAVFLASQPR